MSSPGVRQRSGNLPAELTTFVGRADELAAIGETLGRARLVTLAGTGGVGRTRLALRAASLLAEDFPDGAWLVELSSVTDPALLPDRLCRALSVQNQSARPDTDVLVEHLAERSALLVLDTCEHLVDSCAILVETLLRAAPGLRVLTTTRQTLGVPGEHVIPVAPLPPPPDRPDPGDLRPDALALFLERARAVDPAFAPSPENLAAAARLCRRLDGIPLAIELAAVRLRALSVTQVAERLDDRFRVLGHRSATTDRRHHTLESSIRWSHELCSPEERLVWARLSVFAGDFALEAAERVCGDGDLPDGVLEPLVGLVDKSIVLRCDTPAGPRFAMLDTLREYGTRRLRETGGWDAAVRRHRDHYLDLARRFEADWATGDQLAWCDRLRPEYANVTAALRRCLDDPAGHRAGLALAARLGFFWIAAGHTRPGRELLQAFLERCPDPTPDRAWALWVCGWIATAQADFAAAERAAAESLRIADALGDRRLRAYATYTLGVRAVVGGDLERGVALSLEAAGLFPEGGDAVIGAPLAWNMAALGRTHQGRLDEALELLTRSRATSDAHGEV